jgi:hypothetical protein
VTVPDPLAAPGRVVNDPGERTLIVRPAETGYAALLWREGHRALVDAGEPDSLDAYMRNDAPAPWASGAGQREIARGVPAGDGSLHFKFRRGDPAYKQLVSTPGLGAIITVDRASSRIMGVKFPQPQGSDLTGGAVPHQPVPHQP